MKTFSSGNCTFSVPAKNSYRMVVLGASRVGKSSIVSRFLNGRFEDQYTPTIEDFHRKVYNIRGDMYQLDILDTSGNHPFPAMRRLSILTGGCRGWAWAPHRWACVLGTLQFAKHSHVRRLRGSSPQAPWRREGRRGTAACLSRGSRGPPSILSDSGWVTHDCRRYRADREPTQTGAGDVPPHGTERLLPVSGRW